MYTKILFIISNYLILSRHHKSLSLKALNHGIMYVKINYYSQKCI